MDDDLVVAETAVDDNRDRGVGRTERLVAARIRIEIEIAVVTCISGSEPVMVQESTGLVEHDRVVAGAASEGGRVAGEGRREVRLRERKARHQHRAADPADERGCSGCQIDRVERRACAIGRHRGIGHISGKHSPDKQPPKRNLTASIMFRPGHPADPGG